MVTGAAGDAPLVHGHQRLRPVVEAGHGLCLGDVDVLPAVPLPSQDGHHDGGCRRHAGEVSDLRCAESQRFPVGFAQTFVDTASGGQVDVVGPVVAPRAGQSVGADRRHYQRGVIGGQGVVIQADAVHVGRGHVVHHHIGFGGQAAQDAAARGSFQVGGDAQFV